MKFDLNKHIQLIAWFGALLLTLFVYTCEKVEPAPLLLVSTDTIADITLDGLFVEGTVLHVGEEGITQHGFCWSPSGNPTIDLETKTQLGSRNSTGSFNSAISGLTPNSTYSIRAYATDAKGTVYGEGKTFTTLALQAPVVLTTPVTGIELETAQSGGNITYNGGSAILSRGVCWSTTQNPTLLNNLTEDGTGNGSYESVLTRLDCGSTYYVRAYATNEVGTGYGQELEFTTLDCPVGLPEVLTSAVSDITETTASGGGEVIDQGSSGVTSRGVCWSTEHNPVLLDHHTINGGGVGTYTSSLSGLSCGTQYYIRAYATNGSGTSYGPLDSFQTVQCPLMPPEVETGTVTNITRISAQGGGNVLSDGGAEVTSKGIFWATSPEPSLGDNYTVNGGGSGSFISQMTGLECGTLYYVRAYATNSEGTAYGQGVEFSTEGCLVDRPTVSTLPVSNITQTSAQSGGNITDDGGMEVTSRGICWGTSQNPTLSNDHTDEGVGTGEFSSVITGLSCDTRYYVRAYATNSQGTSYGVQEEFITSVCFFLPTVVTTAISEISDIEARSGGEVTDDGNTEVVARGVCWDTDAMPTIEDNRTNDGNGTGIFVSSLTGLKELTTYYVRAYATNSEGTVYGDQQVFSTKGIVTDYDGNSYFIVQIGNQQWMANNMMTTHYADGTEIPNMLDTIELLKINPHDKSFWWYDNDPAYGEVYGALYTWAAAMNGAPSSNGVPSGVQGVCPDEWHLPSDEEWKELELFLGMNQYHVDLDDTWRGTDEGGMLKETGTTHWNPPNYGATNLTGYSAIPGGYRDFLILREGELVECFQNMGVHSNLWTSTGGNYEGGAIQRQLDYTGSTIWRGKEPEMFGFSVRCVKDDF